MKKNKNCQSSIANRQLTTPPLTKTQLRLIEHYSNTRFNGEFWGSVNVRQVIRQLLAYIKWIELKIEDR